MVTRPYVLVTIRLRFLFEKRFTRSEVIFSACNGCGESIFLQCAAIYDQWVHFLENGLRIPQFCSNITERLTSRTFWNT